MTRGQRNKNPFNIRYSKRNDWQGKVADVLKEDKEFEEFISIDYGIRAGIILLRNYINSGTNTARKIITRFAPSSENDTQSYLWYVSTYVDLDTPIRWRTDDFFKLCVAITSYESNTHYTVQNFRYVVDLFNITNLKHSKK